MNEKVINEEKYNSLTAFKNSLGRIKYDLSIGEPYMSTPRCIKKEVIKGIKNNHSHYEDPLGLWKLRKLISIKEKNHFIEYVSEKNVLITTGATEGLFVSFITFLSPGDEVIIFAPYYPPFKHVLEALDVKLTIIDTTFDSFQLDENKINEHITALTKMIVLCSPSNPTGTILNEESYDLIYEIEKTHPSLQVVIDQTYQDITTKEYTYFKRRNILNQTIFVHSFSKAYAITGYRGGYIVTSESNIKTLAKVHEYNVDSLPSFVQEGFFRALKIKNNKIIAAYRKNLEYASKELDKMGLECQYGGGTFYLFPSILNYSTSSEKFARKLGEKYQVAVLPSTLFGIEGYIRISCATKRRVLKKALKRINLFLKED